MKSKWEEVNFDLMPFKMISWIIKGSDDIQALLDEHIVNT